jgi:integrase
VEASGARWGELDLEEGWWTIPPERFKSGRHHRIYLHPELRRRLEDMRSQGAGPSDLVFRSPRTGRRLGQKSLSQGLRRSNGGAFHVHDIRRSVATAMGDAGNTPFIIERVLGHAQPRLQRTYNRSALDERARDAWMLWRDQLLDLVRKQGGLDDT